MRLGVYTLVTLWGIGLLVLHLLLRPDTMDLYQVLFGGFFLLAGAFQLRSLSTSIRGIQYTFTDHQLIIKHKGSRETIDLHSITAIDLIRPIPERWLGVGDLIVRTDDESYILLGQQNPKALKSALEKASEAAQSRLRQASKRSISQGDASPFSPGTLDRLDTLTGLWQQGLISDEDFEKERAHFERGQTS